MPTVELRWALGLCVVLVPATAAGEPLRTVPLQVHGQGGTEDLSSRAYGPEGPDFPIGNPPKPAMVGAPLPAAYCTAVVEGKGDRDTEMDYLPRVITCENGGANLQALKAQAIAARSVLYYAMATEGSICDGQGCQVYTCGAQPQAVHFQAVDETRGQYLSFNNTLTYGFYVAGDSSLTPPGCVGNDADASTEKYVTYNQGKTGNNVTQTTLGFIFNPGDGGYGQNRGCMGQWGARCLENNNGYDHAAILRFYYGDDIKILTAPGPCVEVNEPPTGNLDGADCTEIRGWAQDPDTPDTPIDVHLYFDGPAGDPNAVSKSVPANVYRDDLCQAIGSCAHGFTLRIPNSLRDDAPHPVHAYGIDSEGGENPQLTGSPGSFTCAPPPLTGVRRHVSNPDVLAAWQFDLFMDLVNVDDPTLLGIPEWVAIQPAPALVQADDGTPEVWLKDGPVRRHVPGPEAAAAWRLDLGTVVVTPAAEVYAIPAGTPLRPAPILIKGVEPAVYVLDDLQCYPGSPDPECQEGPGTTGEMTSGDPTNGETSGDPSDPTGATAPTGDPTNGETSAGSGDSEDGESGAPTSGADGTGPNGPGGLPPGYGGGEDTGGCACRSTRAGSGFGPGLMMLLGLVRRRRGR